MASVCACTGNRTISPAGGPEKADANRQTLTLVQISHLDQKVFDNSLAQLHEDVTQPGPAAADQETLTAIAAKLRQTDEAVPAYWPSVLSFLQFASSRLARKAPPPHQEPRVLSDILSVGIMRGIREDGRTILFDSGSLGNGEFINCRILFTQNPVQMQHVTFRNCAFEFPTTGTPSPYLKKVARIILSSDLGSVSIPTL